MRGAQLPRTDLSQRASAGSAVEATCSRIDTLQFLHHPSRRLRREFHVMFEHQLLSQSLAGISVDLSGKGGARGSQFSNFSSEPISETDCETRSRVCIMKLFRIDSDRNYSIIS